MVVEVLDVKCALLRRPSPDDLTSRRQERQRVALDANRLVPSWKFKRHQHRLGEFRPVRGRQGPNRGLERKARLREGRVALPHHLIALVENGLLEPKAALELKELPSTCLYLFEQVDDHIGPLLIIGDAYRIPRVTRQLISNVKNGGHSIWIIEWIVVCCLLLCVVSLGHTPPV